MSSMNAAIEATKRNRAMMHKPSLFKNMKRYQKRSSSNLTGLDVLSLEERKVFDKRMSAAKRKGLIKELKWYALSTVIGLGVFYVVYHFVF